MDFRSRWMLVTGASSGLGREIARDLALRHRANLVISARREDRLMRLKAELEQRAGVHVEPVVADLAQARESDRLFERATTGRELYGAVLNAGVTHFGEHLELGWEQFEQLVATNITSVARLVHLSIPHLLENDNGGGVMLVTSLTGLIPVPYQTAYSSSKAFVTALGRGLHHELAGKNVSVTTLVPGGIHTEMTERSGLSLTWGADNLMIQAADACAREAVDAFARRRYMHVPRALNRLQLALSPLLPRSVLGARIAAQYRKALARARQRHGS